jgi:nanoRNase/pAp phosphatase (c-di-AMP/oligoRNAs hydrolase)
LAWKYYFSNSKIPNIVRYVKDRDLWRFQEPFSKEINAFIQSYPMTVGAYEYIFNFLEHSLNEAKTAGEAIERYKNQLVESIIKSSILIDGVPTVNTSVLFSEVPEALIKKYGTLHAQYYFDRLNDGVRQYGLRSVGDFDVSEIAKEYGGGGHKNAAGYTVKLT